MMRIFGWSMNHPEAGCAGALVAVACDRASEAARLVRQAGWNGAKAQDAMGFDFESDSLAAVAAEPGVVMWRANADDEECWRRNR